MKRLNWLFVLGMMLVFVSGCAPKYVPEENEVPENDSETQLLNRSDDHSAVVLEKE